LQGFARGKKSQLTSPNSSQFGSWGLSPTLRFGDLRGVGIFDLSTMDLKGRVGTFFLFAGCIFLFVFFASQYTSAQNEHYLELLIGLALVAIGWLWSASRMFFMYAGTLCLVVFFTSLYLPEKAYNYQALLLGLGLTMLGWPWKSFDMFFAYMGGILFLIFVAIFASFYDLTAGNNYVVFLVAFGLGILFLFWVWGSAQKEAKSPSAPPPPPPPPKPPAPKKPGLLSLILKGPQKSPPPPPPKPPAPPPKKKGLAALFSPKPKK